MYLIAIAWMYVVVMMAIAEATGTGTVLGAIFTLLLYGLLPLGIVLYIFGTPGRRQMKRRQEQEASTTTAGLGQVAAGDIATATNADVTSSSSNRDPASDDQTRPASSLQPDRRDHAAGLPVAPKGKESGGL